MYTYQDFESDLKQGMSIAQCIDVAIGKHKATNSYRVALDADNYDAQQNTTIMRFVKKLYSNNGQWSVDEYASNNKICSSLFRRLNTQRNTYSLGNGISFNDSNTKEMLGSDFDTRLKEAGYYALIHGVSYLFWNVDHVHVYKETEFVPLYDEETGALRAGIRFWQIDQNKPMYAVLYEIDGFSKFRKASKDKGGTGEFALVENKRAYRQMYAQAEAEQEPEIVGEENYTALPIIPMYGSRLKQSTLVGMKGSIDAYDLVRSGFANDMTDCSEIYWIVSNAGGMDDADLGKFRQRLKVNHIANVEDSDDVSVTPYTQEIPYQARKEFLDQIRSGIYEDFGGLDIHTISAGSTNDHIEAGYQPLDEQADDFEYEIIQAIQNLLRLIGIEEQTPLFNRNRISNQKEKADMVIECANYLDDETVLRHLPFITPDEIDDILERKKQDDYDAFSDDSEGNNNADEEVSIDDESKPNTADLG